MAVAILKEVESPYDVHDYIRSCLGDTLEAKEFAKQFLERRAKQKASQQRQQQQVRFHRALARGSGGAQCSPDRPPTSAAWQEAWLSSGSLQTAFQTNHSTKLGSGEGSKAKRRALMLHSDPSILGECGVGRRLLAQHWAGAWVGELKPSFPWLQGTPCMDLLVRSRAWMTTDQRVPPAPWAIGQGQQQRLGPLGPRPAGSPRGA